MKELINNILISNIPDFPKQLDLNIPQINLSNLQKVE